MALIVPLNPIPNQTLSTTLGVQQTQINLYQKSTGLFMDVLLNNSAVIRGVICQNLNRIIRDAYLGYSGDFVFLDNQGTNDPFYTGLGSRYQLFYLTAADLAAGLVSVG